MKIKFSGVATAAIIAFAFSGQVQADDWYVSGVVGKSWQAEDVSAYGNNIAVDPDFPGGFDGGDGSVYGIGLGYYLQENLRLEGRITVRDMDFDGVEFGTGARDGEEYQAVGSLESTSYMLNLIYDFSISGAVKPYVKAGLGMTSNDFSTKLGGAGVAAFDAFDGVVDGYYDLYADRSDNNFSWSLGVGADYQISEGVSLFAEYQYITQGDVATGQDDFTDGFEIDGAASNEILLGVKASF